MIPKKIHYCWFGGAPKSEIIQKCMATWSEVLPDYEVREWTENDLNLLKDNIYVQQAYAAKKWAFVSDVFRLYALKKEGGIYLDTDVEIRKPLEQFLSHDFFIGSEQNGKFKGMGSAVIGACADNPIITQMLDVYHDLIFVKEDGTFDYLPNTFRLERILRENGANHVYTETNPVKLNGNAFIYPVDYFCRDSENSFTVHHFTASWFDDFKERIKFVLPWFKGTKLKLSKFIQQKPDVVFKLAENEVKLLELRVSKTRRWLLLRVEHE